MSDLRDFDALVSYLRDHTTAHEWLHELSTLERRLLATAAAATCGTEPLEPDTVLVRQVYNALLFPPRVSVLLGDDRCVFCDQPMTGDSCTNPSCEENAPRAQPGRDHRGWVRQ